MKKVYLIIISLNFITTLTCKAQSRTEIIENKLKSQTIYDVDYENSNGKQTLERIEKFDRKGNLIEIIEYDSKEKVKYHAKYEYDNLTNLTKEIEFDASGNIQKTIVYKYINGLKTERTTYDAGGKKIKVRKYVYDYYE